MGALIAPRPLLIESGREDHLNGENKITNVFEQLNITRSAYSLLNSEDNLVNYVGEEGHYWYSEKTFSFLKDGL